MPKIKEVIGLMSGTSLDGIDAALLRTDGEGSIKPQGFISIAYTKDFRARLRSCFGVLAGADDPAVAAVEQELTALHAEAVTRLLQKTRRSPLSIGLIGFHGQTLWHRPHERRTCQIGDGALLARLTGITVVNDFRSADVQAGGQGAPLASLYHAARATTMPRPLAVLNIGGVANLTWLGRDGSIIAFDTGPGNALLDDWMLRHTGTPYDADGTMTMHGKCDTALIETALRQDYFHRPPPKSLDREEFKASLILDHLSVADGAATLAMLTVRAVQQGFRLFSETPRLLLVTGGGRHHPLIMRWLGEFCGCPAQPVEAVGWNGDALEAEAFGWLAVRHQRGLPLSLPSTTGVTSPMPGGTTHQPNHRK